MARKTALLEAGRWLAVLPAAVLGGLAVQTLALQLSARRFGPDQRAWPDAAAVLLPCCALLAAVLIAAWAAPRARLRVAIAVWWLLALGMTLFQALIFAASEAKVVFDASLIAIYLSGGLACLLVWVSRLWATQRRRPT